MRTANANPVRAPLGVRILAALVAIIGLAALFGSLFLWGQGTVWNAPPGVAIAFPMADILVDAPASILAAIGLWRMKFWGYAAAQFVAGFYVYASVAIFAEVAEGGPPYAMEIVVPQVLAVIVAVALVVSLWPLRGRFM